MRKLNMTGGPQMAIQSGPAHGQRTHPGPVACARRRARPDPG